MTVRITCLLLVISWAASCTTSTPPEKALKSYIQAVSEGRCAEALNLVSARTRYSLESLRLKPQRQWEPIGIETYYCNPIAFENCKSDNTSLIVPQPDAAKVSMPCGRSQDGFLPGFSSIFLKYEPRITEMTYEEGSWRVVEPMVIRIVELRDSEEKIRDEVLKRQRRR